MAILLSIDHQMRTLEPLKKLTLMADGRWRGLAAIVGRRSGHGPALGLLIQHLLADLGVLPALKALHSILPAAKTKLHGIGVVAREFDCALQAAERVHVIAEERVAGRLDLAVFKVIPGAEKSAAIGFCHHCVDLRPIDAARGARPGRIPDENSLSAAQPSRRPHVVGNVVIKSRKVRAGSAIVAIVIENGQFLGRIRLKVLPIEPAKVDAGDERSHDVAGERDIPKCEGVVAGRRLRTGAIGGDHERRIVNHANLADRRPFFYCERARDPGNDVLIFGIVKVDPAKCARRLLRAKRNCKSQRRGKSNEAPGEVNLHEFRYSRRTGVEGLRDQGLRGYGIAGLRDERTRNLEADYFPGAPAGLIFAAKSGGGAS